MTPFPANRGNGDSYINHGYGSTTNADGVTNTTCPANAANYTPESFLFGYQLVIGSYLPEMGINMDRAKYSLFTTVVSEISTLLLPSPYKGTFFMPMASINAPTTGIFPAPGIGVSANNIILGSLLDGSINTINDVRKSSTDCTPNVAPIGSAIPVAEAIKIAEKIPGVTYKKSTFVNPNYTFTTPTGSDSAFLVINLKPTN
jgi:hypothetical protein